MGATTGCGGTGRGSGGYLQRSGRPAKARCSRQWGGAGETRPPEVVFAGAPPLADRSAGDRSPYRAPVNERPILYSFRRCPYAIRARLALEAAGLRPGPDLELREVNLKAKPPELLEASARGTVPALVLPAGQEATDAPTAGGVITESLSIMEWARNRQARILPRRPGVQPSGSLSSPSLVAPAAHALIAANDGPFKHHLDRFRYPSRYADADPLKHRTEALAILRRWSKHLEPSGWLMGDHPSLADWALLPFVRQFRLADPDGFDDEAHIAPLQRWLRRFLEGPELARVMEEDWAPRLSWPSPGWLYHLALAEEWQAVARNGADAVYRRSTRGLGLAEVGFVHASGADQICATYRRFYADATGVLLLTIDPERLQAAGVPVLWEPAAQSGEHFPHIHGALPVKAVLKAEPFRPSALD